MPEEARQTPLDVWRDHTELIRRFLELGPSHDRLAREVAYCLEKRLREAQIEYAAISSRAKALDSFLDKIQRKRYRDPLEQVTDLAGVRLVHLYRSDGEKIEAIIRDEFEIIEAASTLDQQGADRFGYGAIHFVVRLGPKSSGARYDDLKELRCEVQVRTAVQDAWAIISHHLVYKREQDVPKALRRKINSLAGLLETADDQFDQIRIERAEYRVKLEQSLRKGPEALEQEINVDTVSAFLKQTIPTLPPGDSDHVAVVLADLNGQRYRTLADLQDVLDRTAAARKKFYDLRGAGGPIAAAGDLAVALGLDDPRYRREGWDDDDSQAFGNAESLVKKRRK